MMEIKVTNDHKEKDRSFEASAIFNYKWYNAWLGYGGEMTMTAFGKTEEEARSRLEDELFRYQSEFVRAIVETKLSTPNR